MDIEIMLYWYRELRSTGKEKTCELPDGNIITVVPGVSIKQVSSLWIPRRVTFTTARICTPFPDQGCIFSFFLSSEFGSF